MIYRRVFFLKRWHLSSIMLSCRPRADVNYSEIRSASCKSLTAAGLPRFPQRCFQGGMKDVLNRDVTNLQRHRATGPEPPCFPKVRIIHSIFNSSVMLACCYGLRRGILWFCFGFFVGFVWLPALFGWFSYLALPLLCSFPIPVITLRRVSPVSC